MQPFILISVIVLVSGFIQSITGFGFALIATPLLFFLLDPRTAIVIVVCLGSFNMLVLTIVYRKHINKKRTVFLSIGSVIGIPLGAYLLSVMSPTAIKLVVASVTIILSIFLMINRVHYLRPFVFWHIVTGFFSGLLSSSTSMGGPPAVLFLLSQNLNKTEFLGTISAVGIILSIFTIGTFGSMGMINNYILKTSAIALPALAIGIFLGTKMIQKINNNLFRYIAIAVILISAIATIIITLPLDFNTFPMPILENAL